MNTRRWAVPFGVIVVCVVIGFETWAGRQLTAQSVVRTVMFALPSAGIYAIGATGLVVVYSSTGVFNFAQGAVGMCSAFMYWELSVRHGWPVWLSLLAVICVFAPLIGIVLDRLAMRRLARTVLVNQLIATVGIMIALIGLANVIWPPTKAYPLRGLGGQGGITISGVMLSWHRVITIGVALALALALRLVLFGTRLGIAMRAVVDDAELAQLHRVQPGRISSTAWVIGSICAAFAGILIAPEVGNMSAETLSMLIINAFAAAVIGRLRSLPLTYAGAFALGLIVSFSKSYLSFGGRWSTVTPALPAIVLFGALLLLPPAGIHVGRIVRTYPMERPATLRSTLIGSATLIVAALLLSPLLSNVNLSRLTVAVTTGAILLSLVPLIGWAGLPFLAPLALAGFGAWLTWRLTEWMPGLLAMLVAGVVNALIGAIVALPALRLRGLYLALSSIAFASVAVSVIFAQPELFSGPRQLRRPTLFGISLQQKERYLVFAVVVYAMIAIGLAAVRRSEFGRRMVACRDSEAAASCLGISLVETKLVVFALAGFVAGVSGGLYGFGQEFLSAEQFPMILGLALILSMTVWGIGVVSAPLVAGLTAALLATLSHDWAPGTFTRALELVGPGLAALALTSLPRGQIPEITERSRRDPLGSVIRLAAVAAGGTIGVVARLPGFVGFLLAVTGYIVADAVSSAIRERRSEARIRLAGAALDESTPVDAAQWTVGLTQPLTPVVRRRIDDYLRLPAMGERR